MPEFEDNLGRFENWIDQQNKIQGLFPEILKVYELIKLNKNTVLSLPDQAKQHENNFRSTFNEPLKFILSGIGPTFSLSEDDVKSISLTASTGSIAAIEAVNEIKEFSKPFLNWKKDLNESYFAIFGLDKKIDILKKLYSDIRRFDLLEEITELDKEFNSFRQSPIDHSGFAIKLRNVMEHHKGVIKKSYDLSKYRKAKKGKVSWNKMAEEICNPKLKNANQDFVNLGQSWIDIHSYLSKEAKATVSPDTNTLINKYNTTITMLATMTELIEGQKIDLQK